VSRRYRVARADRAAWSSRSVQRTRAMAAVATGVAPSSPWTLSNDQVELSVDHCAAGVALRLGKLEQAASLPNDMSVTE